MLIEGDGAEEGEVDMAVRREKRDQREQAAQDQGGSSPGYRRTKPYPRRTIAAQSIIHLY